MLTDDDLTTELGAAFRSSTTDLTYTGRRRPRRTAVVAVPLAAVGIAVAAIALNLSLGSNPAPAPSAALGTPDVSTTTAAPAQVTSTIKLAGYSFTYQHAKGETAPIYATAEPGPVPDGFTPVASPGNDAKAWVGKDPKTGDNAIYVQIADRNGGNLFALHSSVWTQDELVDFFHNGSRKAVPLIKE